jgi:hypothetical protein
MPFQYSTEKQLSWFWLVSKFRPFRALPFFKMQLIKPSSTTRRIKGRRRRRIRGRRIRGRRRRRIRGRRIRIIRRSNPTTKTKTKTTTKTKTKTKTKTLTKTITCTKKFYETYEITNEKTTKN